MSETPQDEGELFAELPNDHGVTAERPVADAGVLERPPPGGEIERSLAPVLYPAPFAEQDRSPEHGIGLCLSGGGYRAMLFHLGTLWRLNELAYLPRLARVSSVSGGSITAGLLGLWWDDMVWQDGVALDFIDRVVVPLHRLAGKTIDRGAVLAGTLLPFVTISGRVEAAYRRHLFGRATLQDLPDDEGAGVPRFVLNATNVQSGAIWRFARPYMADWRVGRVDRPRVPLAFAVTASSAFPPFLSPARMKLDAGTVRPTEGADLHREPFTTDVVLTDGGVYDNLGLETVWKRYDTVLVSDGGGQMGPEARPAGNWASHGYRATRLVDNQVRALRKRQVVGSLVRGAAAGGRDGAYWRIRGSIDDYPAPDTLPCPRERTAELAMVPTRLASLDETLQQRLVNWGYAICDAGMRAYVDPDLPAPSGFPFPRAEV